MQKRYVQHISGQGQKWQVLDGHPPGLQNGFRPMDHHEWIVCTRVGSEQYYKRWFALPKSEYRLCDPPEEWEDVTDGCTVDSAISLGSDRALSILHALDRTYRVDVLHTSHVNNYRVRKIDHLHNGPAFIIERKK